MVAKFSILPRENSKFYSRFSADDLHRFGCIKIRDLRVIPTHAGSRIFTRAKATGADFLLIPAIAIPSGHVFFLLFSTIYPLTTRFRGPAFVLFFDCKRGVKGDRPEGVWGWLDTHNRYSQWSSWRSNHQPPTTNHHHYPLPLSFCGSNWLPFILFATDSPPFFLLFLPAALRDLTRLHACPTTFTDRGRKLQAYDFLMMVDIEQSKSYAL